MSKSKEDEFELNLDKIRSKKHNKTLNEIQDELNKTQKEKDVKKLNIEKIKPTIETLKTILIVFLITGVCAFVAGMKYQEQRTEQYQKDITVILKEVQKEKLSKK